MAITLSLLFDLIQHGQFWAALLPLLLTLSTFWRVAMEAYVVTANISAEIIVNKD